MSRFRALGFVHLLLPLHYVLAETPLHRHSNWPVLVLTTLWLEHHNEVLTGTIAGLVKPEISPNLHLNCSHNFVFPGILLGYLTNIPMTFVF